MELVHLSAFLGVEARGVDLKSALRGAGADVFGDLRQAVAKHRLVRLREQSLTPHEFVRAAGEFGPLYSLRRATEKAAHFPEHPEIKVVSNRENADGGKAGDGDATENTWHTDGTYLSSPTILTFLFGQVSPSNPPRTIFLSLEEAYRRLPGSLRRQIAGRRALHYSPYNYDEAQADAIQAIQDPSERKYIGYWRPMVVANPATVEPSLMPPRQRNCVIEGLSEEDSYELADELWTFIESLDCTWGEVIEPGDLVFWDNRFSLHMREAFPSSEVRLLWHTTTISNSSAPSAYIDFTPGHI